MPHRLNWLNMLRIRQCVGGAHLSCGCYTGRYLTYSDELVEIVDVHDPMCTDPSHANNTVLGTQSRNADCRLAIEDQLTDWFD